MTGLIVGGKKKSRHASVSLCVCAAVSGGETKWWAEPSQSISVSEHVKVFLD